jgi:hypothetical protein
VLHLIQADLYDQTNPAVSYISQRDVGVRTNRRSRPKKLTAHLQAKLAELDPGELVPEFQIARLTLTISDLTARIALQDENVARLGGFVARLTENPDGIEVVNAKKHKIDMGTNRDIVADGCAIDNAVSSV